MNQINDLILDKLADDIEAVFTAVTESTEQASVIRPGRLQQNPVKAVTSILLFQGDPDGLMWDDSLVAERENALDRQYISVPSFEIGGGDFWWRRFVAEVQYFGVKDKQMRDEARRIANLNVGRVQKAIRQSMNQGRGLQGLRDDLGEMTIMVLPVKVTWTQGGGPPASYIWRAKVKFQVLTSLDY